MRTTLKRGLGRAAAPNGEGKPVFPPDALSPVTVYRQPGRGRGSRLGLIGQIALWLGAASLVLVVGTAGGAYLYFHESVAAVAAKTPEVRRAARKLDVPLPGHPAMALVIGYDRRLADGENAPSRSDTLMLVRDRVGAQGKGSCGRALRGLTRLTAGVRVRRPSSSTATWTRGLHRSEG